jgi:hypothetical protein
VQASVKREAKLAEEKRKHDAFHQRALAAAHKGATLRAWLGAVACQRALQARWAARAASGGGDGSYVSWSVVEKAPDSHDAAHDASSLCGLCGGARGCWRRDDSYVS